MTGDIDYPKAAPVARSRPGELDVGRFYRRENPDRDWLIGKLIEKEYIRNTTTATDMYLEKNEKEKERKERNIGKASKRISVVKLFQNKSIDRSIEGDPSRQGGKEATSKWMLTRETDRLGATGG